MEPEDIRKITKRLDVIINLLLSNSDKTKDFLKDADKIALLNKMNLSALEIAEITGKGRENVDTVIRRLKKKK